jgi:hypothetical protein
MNQVESLSQEVRESREGGRPVRHSGFQRVAERKE